LNYDALAAFGELESADVSGSERSFCSVLETASKEFEATRKQAGN
jgi:hypothetical protein